MGSGVCLEKMALQQEEQVEVEGLQTLSGYDRWQGCEEDGGWRGEDKWLGGDRIYRIVKWIRYAGKISDG